MSNLKSLRVAKGLTQSELATLAGADQSQIAKLESAKIRMTAEWARRLAPHLGIGPEELAFPDEADIGLGAVSALGAFGVPDGAIPEIDGLVGAGSAAEAEVVQIPIGSSGETALGARVKAHWVIPPAAVSRMRRVSMRHLQMIECIGDSMEPRVMDGDIVLIDTSQRTPSPPGIFALWDGYGVTLKRLEIIPNSDPPTLRLIPENPRHETYDREMDEVNIIGRLVARFTFH